MAVGGSSSGSGTQSPIKIFANIFISFIGAGVLGLPYAFKEVKLAYVVFLQGLYLYFLK